MVGGGCLLIAAPTCRWERAPLALITFALGLSSSLMSLLLRGRPRAQSAGRRRSGLAVPGYLLLCLSYVSRCGGPVSLPPNLVTGSSYPEKRLCKSTTFGIRSEPPEDVHPGFYPALFGQPLREGQ